MKFENFEECVEQLQDGCVNCLAEMEEGDDSSDYDWYSKKYKRLNGTLMSLQTEYYDDEE